MAQNIVHFPTVFLDPSGPLWRNICLTPWVCFREFIVLDKQAGFVHPLSASFFLKGGAEFCDEYLAIFMVEKGPSEWPNSQVLYLLPDFFVENLILAWG